MPAQPAEDRLPESMHGGKLGMIRGVVRNPAGRPVADCAITKYPTTTPTESVPAKAGQSAADGTYRLVLPAATYTVRAFRPTTSDIPIYGEVTGVVVNVGRIVTVDITVPDESA